MTFPTRRDFLKVSALALTEAFCIPSFADEPIELVVLHTNDHHGAIVPLSGLGGLAIQSTIINRERAKHKNVLLVDSGDYNTGQPISNQFNAKPDLIAYKLMKYDVMTIGNHEFDHTKEIYQEQVDFLTFNNGNAHAISLVNANVHFKSTGELVLPPYVVKQIAGLRVGVFGVLINQPNLLEGPSYITIDNEIETAKKVVKTLREIEKVDVVIALTHMGDVKRFNGHITSVDLGDAVEGIDLIVDGHAHSYFTQPKTTQNAPVVTANAYSRYVGKAIFRIQNGKAVLDSWTPIPVTTETEPDPAIAKALDPYIQKASADLKTVIAQTSAPFPLGEKESRVGECAVCNLLCDAVYDFLVQNKTPVDFVLSNGGVFRAGLPKGNVTKENIKTCLPYDNTLVLIDMKGSDVLDLFKFVASVYQTNGAFGQVSKQVRYTITYNNGINGVISNLTIGGNPVDPERVYKFAVNSYMYSGGDGYDILKQRAIKAADINILFTDAVIDVLKNFNQPLSPVLDGRITVRGGLDQYKHITEPKKEQTEEKSTNEQPQKAKRLTSLISRGVRRRKFR
ncbi:MAG: 5'-nucleotidase C-terminal domain-containing protein [Thermoguttaceae bacterium]|nr:5'-nucleotidase C-terminal domain-containing protein [Thermoguttaceae bacterium]